MKLLLFCAASLAAAAATFTTCRVWTPPFPNPGLAFDSGPAGCLAIAPPPYDPRVRAEASARESNYGLGVSLRIFQFAGPGSAWSSASASGTKTEFFTFYGVPAGSALSLEWHFDGMATDGRGTGYLTNALIPQNSFHSGGYALIPILGGTVELNAGINASIEGSSGAGTCSFGLAFGSLQVLDPGGVPVTGFTYSLRSGNSYFFRDGTQVEEVPELSTAALLPLALAWVLGRKKKNRGWR